MKSEGHHVALTAGTGIVPFMDLVFYLMRRNLHHYGNKISKDFQGIKHESEFNLLGKSFSFELWGNFRNEDEVIAYDILKAAEAISSHNDFKNFSMNLRIANID